MTGNTEMLSIDKIRTNGGSQMRAERRTSPQAKKLAQEIKNLVDALKMAGNVAAQNNISFEDTITALALLGNNALKGSDAGTSLKTMIMRLVAPTDAAKKQMDALGISIYDAQGAIRPFPDILSNLQQAFAGLDDATRNAAMANLFGADAIRAATWGNRRTPTATASASQETHEAVDEATLSDALLRVVANSATLNQEQQRTILKDAIKQEKSAHDERIEQSQQLMKLYRQALDTEERYGQLTGRFTDFLAVRRELQKCIDKLQELVDALNASSYI